jgi:N-acetylmuramoyl-L-alanine amidase
LGQEAEKTVAGFKNLETKISTANTFEEKGEALVEITDQVKGIGDKMKAFDRGEIDINMSTPELGALFGEGEGSLESLIDGLGNGDSADLLSGLESTVEAIGGDIANSIAQIISLLTGLGKILDGMNAAGMSGSGMDALSATGESMASKADGLMGSLETAAGSLTDISSAQNLSELTGKINNFASDIQSVANEVSAIQNINPVSEFTDNLAQDTGKFGELGQTYKDIKGTVDQIEGQVGNVINTVNDATADVNAAVNDVRQLTEEAKGAVGKITTGGGKLQDIAEATTNAASTAVNNLSNKAGLSNTDTSKIIQQVQSGSPKSFATGAQTTAAKNTTIDPSIRSVVSKVTGFGNTRELVEQTEAECKAQGIDQTLIDNFKKTMEVIEVGLKNIDTGLVGQIKKEKDKSNVWDKTIDLNEYPSKFDTFERFETGKINAVTQSDTRTAEKKPIVFQTCDTKEELQAEVRLFKRPIKNLIVHSTESFKDQYLTSDILNEEHKERGFDTIQYHYLIRRDGTVQRGLPTTIASNIDPKDYRNESVNIALVGGLNVPTGTAGANAFRSGSSFTRAQYTTLDTFIDIFYKGFPGGNVYGYSELVVGGNGDPHFDVEGYVRRKFGKVRNKDV